MSSMRKALWRGAFMALVAVAVMAIGVPAASARQKAAAKRATNWLAEPAQLVEGNHFVTFFHNFEEPEEIESFNDIGLTIDGNFAFLGSNFWTNQNYETQIEATAEYIEEHAAEYNGGGSCTPTVEGELFSGSTAKLADFQLANGLSASGTIEQLECLQVASGPEQGRIKDQSTFGDFSNTFGQSLGIIAFNAAGSTAAAESAAEYLIGQQCVGGAQAGAFREPLGNPSTSCTAGEVEVDSTAIAAQALSAAGFNKAAKAAFQWLKSVAQEEIVGGKAELFWESTACTGSPEPNVNSTAVAAMAYSALGKAGVGKAERWLASQQSPEGWLEGCSDPNAQVLNSNRIRATTQAVLGLLGVTYPELASGTYAP